MKIGDKVTLKTIDELLKEGFYFEADDYSGDVLVYPRESELRFRIALTDNELIYTGKTGTITEVHNQPFERYTITFEDGFETEYIGEPLISDVTKEEVKEIEKDELKAATMNVLNEIEKLISKSNKFNIRIEIHAENESEQMNIRYERNS